LRRVMLTWTKQNLCNSVNPTVVVAHEQQMVLVRVLIPRSCCRSLCSLSSQCIAKVGMGLSEVGLDADRLAICGDCLVEPALPSQCISEVVMALGKIRLRC